ncbi:alpha/beta hydrolase fold-3 domain-containing protein [Hypoxylon sp. FL1284]|nr:alpha/beta hydrolase fold-3 domain-containing protein [Hypoxylon sp. FL1284]
MTAFKRHPLVSYQPLRSLFLLSQNAIIVLCLPYYAAISLIPSLRPNPSWSAKQTFMTRITHRQLDVTSRIGITETLTLEKGKEAGQFQIVPLASPDVYRGPLASETVKPETTGGTWFPHAPGGDLASKTVMLYFHGGAFIQGDGRDGTIPEKVLKEGSVDAVFSLQYRLSGYGGTNPFPAALQDALSSYLFLVRELRVPARHIVLGGDSSGGNLATALLRYLDEFGSAIGAPPPRSAALLSPWVAPFAYDTAANPHRGTDFIPSSYPAWGAHAYAGERWSDGVASPDPYITPLGHPFPARVPLFVNAGCDELLLEDIASWVDQMRGVEGNVVELHLEADAVHDTVFAGDVLGFSDSAWEIVKRLGEFVRRH